MSATNWTPAQKVHFLLTSVPWTIARETTPEGETILRCAEIPDATGAGDSGEAMEADFWESLRASLAAFVHFDQRPPVPAGVALPWENVVAALQPTRITVRISRNVAVIQPDRTEGSSFVNQQRKPGRAVTA